MVTGTHGKTSTTSMLIVALQHCGLDPSFAVGGDLGEAGTNAHHGSGDYFVAEADESDGSLLEYAPDVAVVTNIEVDHLDFFGSAQAYTAVFDDFADRVAPDGALVVCVDDPGAAALAERAGARGGRVLKYGSQDGAEMAGVLLSWEQQGTGAVAHVRLAGEDLPRVMRLSVPGRHMALNALGALLAAVEVGRRTRMCARRPGRVRGRAAPVRTRGHGRLGSGVRRLRPSSDRGPRDAGGGAHAHRASAARCRSQWSRDRRLSAPSVFAHRAFRTRLRSGARRRRPGVRPRRLWCA